MADMCRLPFGQQLQAGDDWSWKETLPSYPPGDFTLEYFLRGPADGATLDLTAEEDPDNANGFLISASHTQTEGLPAGTYTWQKRVSDESGNLTTLGVGTVEVLADIASQTAPYDGRSWVKRTLDAIRANIAGTAGRVEKQYMVAGRELQLRSYEELRDMEGDFANRYKREQQESDQVRGDVNLIRGVATSIEHGPGVWNK